MDSVQCSWLAMLSLVTGLFFPVHLLNQRWSPQLRLQLSCCSTSRILCDVLSIAVLCIESVECFPGMASKFYIKPVSTIPVAPAVTSTITNFIHWYLVSFLLPFASHTRLPVLPNSSVCKLSHFCLQIHLVLLPKIRYLCVPLIFNIIITIRAAGCS